MRSEGALWALRGLLACSLVAGALLLPARPTSAQAPYALLDAAWNAADWSAALAILDTMGDEEQVLDRRLRAHLNFGWELLAAGRCEAAYAQFQRALGLWPGHGEALRGLAFTRGRCPQVETGASAGAGQPTAPRVTPAPAVAAPPSQTAAPPTPQALRGPTTHVVQRGDTLFSLARRYGVSVAELQRANSLRDDTIVIGQVLTIPAPGGAGTSGATSAAGVVTHIVREGDTLFSLARRYGTTIAAIQAANQLEDTRIRIGQRLVIPPGAGAPAGGPTPRTHRVAEGDTLYSLARRYGTTVEAIQSANGLSGTYIVVGTWLVIP